MIERTYRLVRSTFRFHLYEWTEAPADAKTFEKQIYISKQEMGEDPVETLIMRLSAE